MTDVRLIHGDCREVLPSLTGIDCVLTDPPYPNNAGHFEDAIQAAKTFMKAFSCGRWFVFWDEMTVPPVPLPLVARHIWHRTNTNRPDNYEAIYEFNADGKKQASRVFATAVISAGLTGCTEATGHPTQKNVKLITAILERCNVRGRVIDPFMGSGTTGVGCVRMNRNFIGIEIDEYWFCTAQKRIHDARSQGNLFAQE